MRCLALLLGMVVAPATAAPATAALPPATFGFSAVFGSRMVLQRAPAKAAVFGGGCEGGVVSVSLSQELPSTVVAAVETVTATAGLGAGEWKALLSPRPAGGSYSVTATCTGATTAAPTATLQAVTFGDVWFCSGQSNMELNMEFTHEQNATYANISAGRLSNIRVFHMGHNPLRFGQHADVLAGGDNPLVLANWTTADAAGLAPLGKSGKSVFQQFSAACLYFGVELTLRMQQQQQQQGAAAAGTGQPVVVPLGLVESAFGGTTIEQWMSPAAQLRCANVTCVGNHSLPFSAATAEQCANGGFGGGGQLGAKGAGGNGALWEGQVRPFVNMTVTGWLWYQGENNLFADAGNAAHGDGYACLLQQQMAAWRETWSAAGPGTTDPLAPFGIVMLADATDEGWGCNSLQMHWAQTANRGIVPNAAFPRAFVAAAHDLGEPWDDGCKNAPPYCCIDAVGPPSFTRDASCGLPSWLIATNKYPANWTRTWLPTTPQFMGGIHPSVKRPVGRRLAQAAWSLHYGHADTAWTGPVVSGCAASADGATLVVRFNGTLLGATNDTLVVSPYNRSEQASATFVRVGSPLPPDAERNFLYANRKPWWGDDGSWHPIDLKLDAATGEPLRGAAPHDVVYDIRPFAGQTITGIKYGHGIPGMHPQSGHARVCCGSRQVSRVPCPPDSCPISSSGGLPAMPFHAAIVGGVCRCLAPQLCDEPIAAF